MKLTRFIASIVFCASLGLAAHAAETNNRPLTETGGNPLWGFVDKVAFPNGSENVRQTLKDDILPGEATLAPVGGQTFKFDHRDFQWRIVSLVDGYFNMVSDFSKGGKPLDYSAGYAYCVVHSPTARKVSLVIGSDDSFKVYLNGKLAGSGFYERGISSRNLEDTVELDLKQGNNALLVRVDNYQNDMGLYCKLVDGNQKPVKDITVSVSREQSSAVMDFLDTLDYHYSSKHTLAPLAEPHEELFGSRIQRTMTLLQTSTPVRRNKVKILFYGQSIVAGDWYGIIEKNLRERFPFADLEIKNLAIGGHTAPVLVRCAAQDVYP